MFVTCWRASRALPYADQLRRDDSLFRPPTGLMLALRYVYVLALAIWLGSMVGAVLGTPNARFQFLAPACAGSLVVTLVAMAVLGPRPAAFAVRLILSGVMLLVALYSALALPAEALQQLAAPLIMVNLAAALVLLYWEARNP